MGETVDLAHLQQWVGRQTVQEDEITAFPMRALKATLESPQVGDGDPGDVLPPLWHWLYFLPLDRQSLLGPDGHARRGGFLPPVALPRRMWAGGRFGFMAPIRVGERISRSSTVWSVKGKSGRSGSLVFVTVRHQFHVGEAVRMWEEHDIVYREMPRPGEPLPAPVRPGEGAFRRVVVPDDVLLFRYSALTFNSHRIHYDRRYVSSVESYPGLVVHGPLIATLLLDLIGREMPDRIVTAFSFRALRPTFDGAPFSLHGTPDADGRAVRLWACDGDGCQTMEAMASLSAEAVAS
ncbi:MAG: MaoC family dehydratase N-terminal domain-containing protein [Rhodocyclaceae bacterium]|nr:MaoC family dehydratase N-terminal domain-containing protein [Rhodocyclaceae bacterium]